MAFAADRLQAMAGVLRSLHLGPEPLLLANVWDAASARLVEEAGFPVVATSSAAIASSLGVEDGDAMGADLAFAALARVVGAVTVPVTADLEAGYGLAAPELVERLLEAGAVGCNLEDSDHHGSGLLVDCDAQAARIAAVCESARSAGVAVVVNARTDVYVRQVGEPKDRLREAVHRGQKYLLAGAACVYPIGVTAESEIAALVEQMGGPVNVWLRSDAPPLATLRRLGVARISMAAGLQRSGLAKAQEVLAQLRQGDDSGLR
ncbi:MAG: isocitrate lyase/PEP mutase family protein [Candidatus Dormibacteria bacterium]